MRVFRLTGAVAMVLALTGIISASASAVEAELLPGKAGTTITGKSGKLTLQIKGGSSISCAKSKTASGEILTPTTFLLVIDFEGCQGFGVPAVSLGDEKELILVHFEGRTCLTSEKPLVGAVLLKPLPVHIDFPSIAGLLIVLEGDIIALLTPENKKAKEFTLNLKQTAGVNEHTKCKDKEGEADKTEILLSSLNGGAFVQTGIAASEATFTVSAEQEFMT